MSASIYYSQSSSTAFLDMNLVYESGASQSRVPRISRQTKVGPVRVGFPESLAKLAQFSLCSDHGLSVHIFFDS